MVKMPSEFAKLFIGLDNLQDTFFTAPVEYPRYNVVKVGADGYRIEVALPGWEKDQVKVICTNNVLSIEGDKKSEVHSNEDLIHKGISGKSFERRFKLDSDLEVKTASMDNGMLKVGLEYSEASKPTVLEIQ
jgi:molecular chaperone IbpA